ncbi:uncharacterized protein LOC134782805 isoform X4 [Penaeus indicus]|uniref:uncharacterized protein LOC134782805 isoform X4 n=1 Tax=Penaeus indicus TaxID=29960 RepID=UPI00300D5D03
MENGGVSSQSTTAPSDVSKSQTPIYSRELTLQAHFTFGTPSMAPVQYAHVTPTSTSSVSGRPLMASGGPVEHFRWGAEHGAQCSITCGREGLTMTYNAPSAASPSPALAAQHLIPCAICNSLALNRAGPPLSSQVDTAAVRGAPLTASAAAATSITTTSPAPAYTRSLMDLSRPGDQVATRSLTFSGSLDRATQRPQQQRPYGRRCKSTAHIILQNNELQVPRESRPHEFHSTLREEDAPGQRDQMMEVPDEEPLGRPGPEGRGRARHRGGAEPPYTAVGSGPSGGWERGHAGDQEARGRYFEPSVHHTHAFPPPCCPCQHCSALYSIVSTLTHDRPCPVCPHHHHHHHHHHHPSCSPHVHPHHTQGPPDYPPPGPVGAEEPRAPPAKSPTTRTFNSHRCYEDDLRRPERPAKSQPSHLVPQPKARTPSPKPKGRLASPARSPARSLSPVDRRAAAAEEQHPRTTPILPRRVPRMGAAAAAAAAASSTHATGQAQQRLEESSHKLDLIRLSLERLRGDLPHGSIMAGEFLSHGSCSVKRELENSLSASPSPANYTSLYDKENYPSRRSQALHSKGAAVTGKLEVRLIGVQDLLEDVPGRSRRDSHSGPSDLKSFMKGVTGKSSKSYSVKDEISNEVMAVLKLDNNKVVGQTSWKPCSQSAWDQRFSIDLDKSRDLEIDIYWRDWRSLCAVKFLRLEEFIDDVRHGMALQLEPKGLLFTEIKFLNPMISRKPKLQRQKKLFMQKGKVLRPNQMNINVAAWGRLIKNIQPSHEPVHLSYSGGHTGAITSASSATPITPGPRTVPTRLDFDSEKTPGEVCQHRPLALSEVAKRPTSTPPPPPPRPHSGTVTISVPASPVESDVKVRAIV